MHENWPHPPAAEEPRLLLPQRAFIVRAVGLGALATGAGLSALSLLRTSWWLAPVASVAVVAALLAAWGAVVQWVGAEKVDDHPWV